MWNLHTAAPYQQIKVYILILFFKIWLSFHFILYIWITRQRVLEIS